MFGISLVSSHRTLIRENQRFEAEVQVQFGDWENPGQDRICYAAFSSNWLANAPREFLNVSKVTARVYNWAVDVKRSEENWSGASVTTCLDPGVNRPWVANSEHTATYNGVTLRTSLSTSR